MAEIKRILKTMLDVFVKQRVLRSAAAMSYYITISIFPFMIVIYAILSSLNITNENLYKVWEQIIPADVLSVIVNYLQYVGGNQSTFMVIVGVTVTISSSSTAFGSLMRIMADIQGQSRFKGFWAKLYSIAISLGMIAVMYISALVILTGEWLLDFLEKTIGFAMLLDLWQWVRFAILFLLLLIIIYLIYQISAPKERRKVRRMPGAMIASVLLVAVSMLFSRLVGQAANYPIIYGSLASFIILMLWINICSLILIMGNVFNYVVYHYNPEVRRMGEYR